MCVVHSWFGSTMSKQNTRILNLTLNSCNLWKFKPVTALCTLWNMLSANEDRFWHGSMWNTWHAGSMWSWALIPPLINTAWSKVFGGHLSHLASDTRWQMLCISGLLDQYVIREQPLGGMSINSGLSAAPLALSSGAERENGGCLFNSVPVEDLRP